MASSNGSALSMKATCVTTSPNSSWVSTVRPSSARARAPAPPLSSRSVLGSAVSGAVLGEARPATDGSHEARTTSIGPLPSSTAPAECRRRRPRRCRSNRTHAPQPCPWAQFHEHGGPRPDPCSDWPPATPAGLRVNSTAIRRDAGSPPDMRTSSLNATPGLKAGRSGSSSCRPVASSFTYDCVLVSRKSVYVTVVTRPCMLT